MHDFPLLVPPLQAESAPTESQRYVCLRISHGLMNRAAGAHYGSTVESVVLWQDHISVVERHANCVRAHSVSPTGTAVAVAPAFEPSVLAKTSKESIRLSSEPSTGAASSVAASSNVDSLSQSMAIDKQKIEQFAAHYRHLTTADLSSMKSSKDGLLPEARMALELELRTRPEPHPSKVDQGARISSNERVTKRVLVGRIGRLEYAAWLFPTFFLEVLCMVFGNVALAIGNGKGLAIIPFLAGIACVSLTVLSVFLVAGRAHDLDMTGWSFLILTIPLVNLAFGIYLLERPGTAGKNSFGSEPPTYWPSLRRLRTLFIKPIISRWT
jgi:uncharacterized membrane protein YhaH (DUF805 family)